MPEPAVSHPPAPEKPRPGLYFNPYFQIFVSIVLSAAAQVFMKLGADSSIKEIWLGIEGLRSGWMWLGIGCMLGSLYFWLYSLRFVALNIAFNLAGLIHVLVPLACWIFLGEHIGPKRAAGILLVLIGVLVVARPLMQVEEKL